jgi:hypothetical protein
MGCARAERKDGIMAMTTSEPRTKHDKERLVLVAVALAGFRLADVRERCAWLTDREFTATMRDLVTRQAIIREGSGRTATLRRDLSKWLERAAQA